MVYQFLAHWLFPLFILAFALALVLRLFVPQRRMPDFPRVVRERPPVSFARPVARPPRGDEEWLEEEEPVEIGPFVVLDYRLTTALTAGLTLLLAAVAYWDTASLAVAGLVVPALLTIWLFAWSGRGSRRAPEEDAGPSDGAEGSRADAAS